MISRHETILESLTDQTLQHTVNTDFDTEWAKTLLGVQPEYRQGIQNRVWQLISTCTYLPNGFIDRFGSDISPVDAFARALRELDAQLDERLVDGSV